MLQWEPLVWKFRILQMIQGATHAKQWELSVKHDKMLHSGNHCYNITCVINDSKLLEIIDEVVRSLKYYESKFLNIEITFLVMI